MSAEPAIKRAIAFIDGQNLFYAVKNAFGYKYPNYDVGALAGKVAFPVSPVPHNRRGINGTDWIKIDRATYDACLDTREYRRKQKPTN